MLLPPGSRCIVPTESTGARGTVLSSYRGSLEVALDDGRVVWAEADEVQRPPDDIYERAIADPTWFYEDLFELGTDRRRQILGAIGEPAKHFALLRRLLFPASFAVGVELVPDCDAVVGALALLAREANRAGLYDRISPEVVERMTAVLDGVESSAKDHLLAFAGQRVRIGC